MYKIFINEKPLTFSKNRVEGIGNKEYSNTINFNTLIDSLFESGEGVNIYAEDMEAMWVHFTSSIKNVLASGGVVSNKKDEYLYIKRNGMWDLPKGHVEDGEDIKEAALREVEEECGVEDLSLKNFIGKTYHVYFREVYCLKITYWYAMESNQEKLVPQEEEGIEEVVWLNKVNIQKNIPGMYMNIKQLTEDFVL